MLRLLHSIFGQSDKEGGYPESLVKNAIERAVDGTDPWLRAVSGYKKKLRPAVLRAIDHVVALVDSLPPPIAASLECYGEDPRLKAFFISKAEMRQVFGSDRNLLDFLRKTDGGLPQVIALLFMEKKENMILGAELSGDIVMRDVPQMTVSFESHRLIEPSGDEGETRFRLKRRAFDYLISVALKRITSSKVERKDLERHRALLQAKLGLLHRGGWGFAEAGSAESPDIQGLEEMLGQVEAQLLELGGDDDVLEAYLNILTAVLGRPEEHLYSKKETLIIDRMGIKRGMASSNVPELTLDELCDAEGRCRVVSLVALPGEELR